MTSFCLRQATGDRRQATGDRRQTRRSGKRANRHPEHPDYFPDSHREWSAEQRAALPDLDEDAIAAFGRNMWNHDFVFSVDRAMARTCPVPTFLLPGTDIPHPAVTSADLAELLPGVEVLTDWRGPEHLSAQESRVVAFLEAHRPAG